MEKIKTISGKKSQVAIFLIIGVVLAAAAALYFGVYSESLSETKASPPVKNEKTYDADTVSLYVEACLEKLTKEALFRIGLQGGYIDLSASTRERTAIDSPYPVQYSGDRIAFWLDGYGDGSNYQMNLFLLDTTNDLTVFESKVKGYVLANFDDCFQLEDFKGKGIEIEKPLNRFLNVSINEEDVSVFFNYPLKISGPGIASSMGSFTATLPVRIKPLYTSAKLLMGNVMQTQSYEITQDCSLFDKNGLTNVYVRGISEDGITNKTIIQFVDFSTYKEKYLDSFILQFALKNVTVLGSCIG